MTTDAALVGAFRRGNEHTLTLLGALDIEALLLRPRRDTRTVGETFAHLHEVRLRRLETVGGRDLLEDLEPLEDGDTESRDALAAALRESGDRVARFFERSLPSGAGARGFASLPDFFAYLIAHDAHHRGQILALLAREKVSVPDTVAYGLWKWT